MQRTGQTLPCQAPSRPSYIPGHSSLNRRCNTRCAIAKYQCAYPQHCKDHEQLRNQSVDQQQCKTQPTNSINRACYGVITPHIVPLAFLT